MNVIDKSALLDCLRANCETEGKSIYCDHLTQVFLGRKKSSPVEVVPIGTKCLVTIDALVINRSNGSAAYRVSNVVTVDGEDVAIDSRKPHITALVASGSKPMDSVKFVFDISETVTIIPVGMVIETTCVWN